MILRGDYSGPAAAQAVLREPTVEHAVLEVARGGIMRRGLGFDECDVGVLLNIASDHLGERDIHTLEELARCKTVVVDAVKKDGGYCVLNADDPLVMEHGTYWARGEIIYFTMDPENPALDGHLAGLGMVLTVKHGKIVLLRGKVTVEIVEVNDVPIAFEGHAPFNVQNAMAAAAAAIAHGIEIDRYPRGPADLPPDAGADAGPHELFRGGRGEMPDRLRPQRPGADRAGAAGQRSGHAAQDRRRDRPGQPAGRGSGGAWRAARPDVRSGHRL